MLRDILENNRSIRTRLCQEKYKEKDRLRKGREKNKEKMRQSENEERKRESKK